MKKMFIELLASVLTAISCGEILSFSVSLDVHNVIITGTLLLSTLFATRNILSLIEGD